MDSTILFETIQQVDPDQQLVELLPNLAKLSESRLTTKNMSQAQIMAQVHKCIQKSLKKTEGQREALINEEDDGQYGEESQEQQESQEEVEQEMEGEEMSDEEQQEEQYEQAEDEEGMQGELPYDMYDQGIEEQQEEGDDSLAGEEEVYEGEEDVGIYGEELDEEELESYENEGESEEEREFAEEAGIKKRKPRMKEFDDGGDDSEGDEVLDDNFDRFREIQMQNRGEQEAEEQPQRQRTGLQRQIQKLEDKAMSRKAWVMQGQVRASQRPVNSLLEQDLQFSTGIRLSQQITPQYNQQIEQLIKQRVLDEVYDDRVRYQHAHVLREQFSSLKEVSRDKSKQGLAELYQEEFKNHLGLAETKQDRLKAEIMEDFKMVNYYLDSLSNNSFTPRPIVKGEASITQDKVPVMGFKGSAPTSQRPIVARFESEKEQNKKGKRVKSKRIERQRRKEQARKKLNRKIEYGGATKTQAKAMLKRNANALASSSTKFNKSNNFFAEMNQSGRKAKKPNPHIGRLKL